MSDPSFNFSYNFNDITQLVFSKNKLLDTPSYSSPIAINPSLNSSVSQNIITINYTEGTKPTSLTASINKISITADIIGTSPYAIVLEGSILTKINSNLYIVIPFNTGATNNQTGNSLAIEQIVTRANNQIINTNSDTILQNPISLNALIENKDYSYYNGPTFTTTLTSGSSNFILYKKNPGQIGDFKVLTTGAGFSPIVKISPTNIAKTNKFSPEFITNVSSNEIMIDCQPVEITTKEQTVLFQIDKEKSKESTNQLFINFLIAVFFGLIFFFIAWHIWKYWSYVFLRD
jgi:hypothetical protein